MTRRFFMALALLPLLPVAWANRMLRGSGWRVIPPSPVRRSFSDGCMEIDLENRSRVLYRVWPEHPDYFTVPWVPQHIVFYSAGEPMKMHWVGFHADNPRMSARVYGFPGGPVDPDLDRSAE